MGNGGVAFSQGFSVAHACMSLHACTHAPACMHPCAACVQLHAVHWTQAHLVQRRLHEHAAGGGGALGVDLGLLRGLEEGRAAQCL